MDVEPPVKRPCLKQTTLFGQVVVTDAGIYAKPTNDCHKHDADHVWQTLVTRGPTPSSSTLSSDSPAKVQLITDLKFFRGDVSRASLSQKGYGGGGEGFFAVLNSFCLAAVCQLMRWPLTQNQS